MNTEAQQMIAAIERMYAAVGENDQDVLKEVLCVRTFTRSRTEST
jgi:hypothetical protein